MTASLFEESKPPLPSNPVPSSSPAFGTPLQQEPSKPIERPRPSVLPIILQPTALRPLAFRTFTKKHNLTLTSSALQQLATFVGKHCGSGWREEGLAEKVLDAAAKTWKRNEGGLIVSGDGEDFIKVLRQLESSISGGRISESHGLSRQGSFSFGEQDSIDDTTSLNRRNPLERQDSLGLSSLAVEDDENSSIEPRKWMKVVGAFEQPRFEYNTIQKHFELKTHTPSLFPQASHKTEFFRHRYNLIHQILLRNESFQTSSVFSSRRKPIQRSASSLASAQEAYKLTPIGNLLGRSGSNHILLGLLTISPSGLLTINDLTGSIALDITHARPAPEDGAWFTPGMIVLVDGIYEEGSSLQGLDRNVGIGGSIGGKFLVFSIGGPPCERRDTTLGVNSSATGNHSTGGGFGWVDFLGVGSERAAGTTMRRLEQKTFRESSQSQAKMIFLGDVTLDNTHTLQGLRKVLSLYDSEQPEHTPLIVVLFGDFAHTAVMAGNKKTGSLDYKESFDALASVMSDFSSILQNATLIFVPGDNDPWASSFSAGAANVVPRDPVPGMFTSRVRKAFTAANIEAERATGKKTDGEAIWTSNPSRISLFGPVHEIVLFRDNISGRLRRNAVRFKPGRTDQEENQETDETAEVVAVDPAVEQAESTVPQPKRPTSMSSELQVARKLVKTILDQAYLSPFPTSTRPVLWDYATALQLYPLPTALVLMDSEAPTFSISYQGCLVMNPGPLTSLHTKNGVQWIEYDVKTRQGTTRVARM